MMVVLPSIRREFEQATHIVTQPVLGWKDNLTWNLRWSLFMAVEKVTDFLVLPSFFFFVFNHSGTPSRLIPRNDNYITSGWLSFTKSSLARFFGSGLSIGNMLTFQHKWWKTVVSCNQTCNYLTLSSGKSLSWWSWHHLFAV